MTIKFKIDKEKNEDQGSTNPSVRVNKLTIGFKILFILISNFSSVVGIFIYVFQWPKKSQKLGKIFHA